MSKKENKSRKVLKKAIEQEIIEVFKSKRKTLLNYKQISSLVGVHQKSDRKLIQEVIYTMLDNEQLLEPQRGKYIFNESERAFTGNIEITQRGNAYVIVEGLEDDILVKKENVGHAFHGDIVKVKPLLKKGKQKQGKVIEIVERKRTEFVGVIEVTNKFAFVRPDNSKIHVDFYISSKNLKGAKNGEKVLVKFTEWPNKAKNPYAEVKEVLGMPGDNDSEIHAILLEYGLPFEFPKAIEAEAEKLKLELSEKEIKARRDFRDTLTITIDPYDAKDFDDAISLKTLDDNLFEIGVHIADVAHYVTPGSLLDKEAYNRGNSVYLVDRVVPMLPEVLSNGLCSLRPNEDKFVFSAVFHINEKAEVIKEWFGRSIIHSDRRFSYEDAQERIETKEGDLFEELCLLDKLAKIMRKKRLTSGALEIESRETKFRLNEKGEPFEVYTKTSKDANKLVEEYMLLANKKVASFIGKPEQGKQILPCVYRIHDKPSDERIHDLKIYIERFGYQLKLEKNKPISHALNKLLNEAKENDDHAIISPMVIKSMAKAVYSTENIGHYGLAFDYYSHFTSPIRRYADLLVHRILQNKLTNQSAIKEDVLSAQCKHISNTEKEAVGAERSSIKFMQVKYMLDKIGEVFSGRITGVTDWGIFVEITENNCEGLVHIRTMNDDAYYFDQESLQIIGRRSKKTFGLGDVVLIEVKNANLMKKQLDFALVND